MGISSSKTKTTQNTNQTESGTTTPTLPPWMMGMAEDYGGMVRSFGDMDPNSFVAEASPLQRMAWGNVDALSRWQPQVAAASQMAQQAGEGGPNFAGRRMSSAPKGTGGGLMAPAGEPGSAFQAQTSQYNAPALGSAALVSGQGYTTPRLGTPTGMRADSYTAPQIGPTQGYAAARAGSPIGATSQGYNPDLINSGARIEQTPGATAFDATAGDIAGGIGRFQNPYVNDVVNTGLAQHDRSLGEAQARLAAQGARAGAFGGSRFGIAEAELGARGAMDRASLEAGLRSQAFDTAAGLAGQQAGMDQGTSLFNAGNRTNVSLANAGQQAQRALAQGGLDQATQFANQGAYNRAQEFGAAAGNQANLFNADLSGRMALDQAARQDAASQFGAAAGNQANLAQAGLTADASRFGSEAYNQAQGRNMDAQNQFVLTQAGMDANAGQFGAQAANNAGLFNAGAQNDFALQGANLAAQGGMFNAGAQNQANQFNAATNNQMSQFNAGQADNAQARALQSAGLLGGLANDYSGNTRQDLALMSAMGGDQRAVEQAYAMAGPAQLQMLGQLGFPLEALIGRQVNGTTTGTMTGTQSSSPSLFNQLMGVGSLFA